MKTKNTWYRLLQHCYKNNTRPAIYGVHVGADGFGQATNGQQLLRVPLAESELAAVGDARGVIVPRPVVTALAAGATAHLAPDGWHVDGSDWAIDRVEANYPDTARVIPVGGSEFTVNVPLGWMRELDAKQWSRADRALLASKGCNRPPRLGVLRGKHDSLGDDYGPILLVRRRLTTTVWDCDVLVTVREPAGAGRYRQYRTRQGDWKPDFGVVLWAYTHLADKDERLTLRTNGTQNDPVAVDLDGEGIYVRMPLRDAPHTATEGNVFEYSRQQWLQVDAER